MNADIELNSTDIETDDEVDDNSKEEPELNADIDWIENESGKNDEVYDNSKADNDSNNNEIELDRTNNNKSATKCNTGFTVL